MTQKERTNLPASVFQRLLNIAKKRGEDFQRILGRYALERFLYRLSQNPEGENFVLKGALLFEIWDVPTFRPTRDADFLGTKTFSRDQIIELFSLICKQKAKNDGLKFHPESIRTSDIRGNQTYGGIQVNLTGHLGQARITLRFDVGFGDVIIPNIEKKVFPTLLSFPAPRLKIYSRYSFVSEKFQSIVVLGMANSRVKDYYDIYVLSESYGFKGPVIYEAVRETFKRRKTEFPKTEPLGLSGSFFKDRAKNAYWKSWLNRIDKSADDLTLEEVVQKLREFLLPISKSLINNEPFKLNWTPGGPWS